MIMYSQTIFAQELITNSTSPVSYFVNHVAQLNLLSKNLNKFNKASILGTSGIGKTQLVRMYIQENKSKYDIVWFFDTNLSVEAEFARLAKYINSSLKNSVISEEEASAKKEVLRYLAETNHKWILIFDNLKAKQNSKILEFVEWESNGHIIFCSQDSEYLPNIVKMEAFNKDHSIDLVNMILAESDNETAEFMAEEFSGYPVLMVQGAQLLNNVKGLDKAIYIKKVLSSADKIQANIDLAINALTPSAKKILYKIVLINTQAFSKNFISIISDDKETVDEDLYQLSKFALISSLGKDEISSTFEMHDIITLKILESMNNKEKKKNLEEIVDSLMRAMPESVQEGHIFRTSKTVHENIEVIIENLEKYKPNIYKLMELNLVLVTDYINTLNYDKAVILVDWFNEKKAKEFFEFNSMNSYEKYIYSRYLGVVGGYYRLKTQENSKAIECFIEAKKVLDGIVGYNNIKSNTIYQLSLSQIATGNLQEASSNIQVIENMLNNGLVEKSDGGLVHLAKAKLLTAQGDFVGALEEVNKDISLSLKYGLKENDLLFSSTYLLKSEILNYLRRYQEALGQAELLYNMHKSFDNGHNNFLSRVYTQIARSHEGLKDYTKAISYSTKSISIISQNMKENTDLLRMSTDIEIAKTYVTFADIISKTNHLDEAISAYEIAEGIYRNAYKNHAKGMQDIVYAVFSGAKTAYHKKNKFWYKHFYNSLKSLVTPKDPKLKDLSAYKI